jgi:O-antigen/teichoic acid export membrane protein
MTHYERAMLNLALATLAAAGVFSTFGASLAITRYFGPSTQLTAASVGLITLTATLLIATLSRAASELIISRSTWRDHVQERESRRLEILAQLHDAD